MKKYSLSVIEFALPSPRSGSIDSYSGFGNPSRQAIKKHQEIQLAKLKENENYQAEVSITSRFSHKRKQFYVSGRMDGIYTQEDFIIIEEIKTAFDIHKLLNNLEDGYYTHPYWLQLQTYGYMYWQKTNKIPKLQLLIASLRKNKTQVLSFNLDIQKYEAWLSVRLDELYENIIASHKIIIRRTRASGELRFPFQNPRPQQSELIESISKQFPKNTPMLIQAPTGLGKTMGVLFPVLKESLCRGQKTIYLTPKNSQHQIAVESIKKLQENGPPLKSLVLTAKKKLCMKNEPLCNAKYCEFAEHHFTKVTEGKLLKKVQRQQNVSALYFRKMATEYKVCPYELQMQSIPFFDIVIGDYNYVFGPNGSNVRVSSLSLGETEKTNLVIDEIHNLPARSMDYFSPELAIHFFWNLQQILGKYPTIFREKFAKILNSCTQLIGQCAIPNMKTPHRIDPPGKSFRHQHDVLNEFLTEYLESNLDIEEEDPIIGLCNYWADFTDALEYVEQGNGAFFTSFDPTKNTIKITCCDASSLLEGTYSNFEQVVGFSATLKPFDYYSRLLGLKPENLHTEEFLSPFSSLQRKMLIIPQISSKYRDRAKHSFKIKEAISRITALKPGNYLIFFPSFDFLERVYGLFSPSSNFTLLKQTRNMSPIETKSLLSKLALDKNNHLIFAVQGGMLAEGIDYVGTQAIGAFIIGPPLPLFDWEREQMKQYYDKQYQAGEEYSYIYPAMAKAVQAAGRVIRTETDRGIIILLDDRFLLSNYSQCMPIDWFTEHPKELVSNSILHDLEKFWAGTPLLTSESS